MTDRSAGLITSRGGLIDGTFGPRGRGWLAGDVVVSLEQRAWQEVSQMWRFLFIGFLIAHGFIHVAMWILVPKPAPGKEAPFDASHSWLLGTQKALAASLAAATAAILVAAGVGLLTHADWWRAAAVIGLTASFLLIVVYFNPWFIPIEAINTALIASILWLSWPSKAMVGG